LRMQFLKNTLVVSPLFSSWIIDLKLLHKEN
jgi:hypothetical protein